MRLLRDFSTNLSQFLENEMMAAQKSRILLYDTLLTVENGRVDSKMQPLKGETDEAFHELKEITKVIRGKVSGALNELSLGSSRLVEGLQDGILECKTRYNLSCFFKGSADRLFSLTVPTARSRTTSSLHSRRSSNTLRTKTSRPASYGFGFKMPILEW
jgi:hypothetical protein